MRRYKRKTDPDTDPLRGRPTKESSEAQARLVATGQATMAQLAGLFRTDAKTLPKRLTGLLPAGRNANGHKTYWIDEAATMIVRPGYEIEQYIRQMSPQELPPLLSKEFWNGINARTKSEREIGNLWPTERVVEVIATVMNAMRMAILLVKDGVEREVKLSDRQRKIIQRMMDGALTECQNHINEAMEKFDVDYEPDDGAILGQSGSVGDDGDDGNILAAEVDQEEDIGI